jgi:hypothetical protein
VSDEGWQVLLRRHGHEGWQIMLGQGRKKVHEAVQEKWRVHKWKVLRRGGREVRDELLRHEVRAP